MVLGDLGFEWDEAKRLATLAKHGIDFNAAISVFGQEPMFIESVRGEEKRWIAVGLLKGIEIAVVFTLRGEVIRIITARRARHGERRAYHARHS
jgi:uncharacterized DUF497 family protein